jgi:hypothetical protein
MGYTLGSVPRYLPDLPETPLEGPGARRRVATPRILAQGQPPLPASTYWAIPLCCGYTDLPTAWTGWE